MTTIIERTMSWEAAAEIAGIHPIESLPCRQDRLTPLQEAINAFFQLNIIAKVLREDIILDWTNPNQKKWYCWFYDYKPGSGFSFDDAYYGWTDACTDGGARLCVDTEQKAEHFGKQFLPIWNKFLNPNQ